MNPIPSSKDPILHARIVSPKGIVFEGQVYSISSENSAGKFDILPGHANFITIINNKPINIRAYPKQDIHLKVPVAVVHIINNLVTIYTDIQLQLN